MGDTVSSEKTWFRARRPPLARGFRCGGRTPVQLLPKCRDHRGYEAGRAADLSHLQGSDPGFGPACGRRSLVDRRRASSEVRLTEEEGRFNVAGQSFALTYLHLLTVRHFGCLADNLFASRELLPSAHRLRRRLDLFLHDFDQVVAP